MSDDKPISSNLAEYRKAMEEELKVSADSTSDELAAKAKEKLFSILPEATEELVSIMRTGTKDDAVRFNAAKFIFEATLGKPKAADPEKDDITKLIEKMQAKAPATSE